MAVKKSRGMEEEVEDESRQEEGEKQHRSRRIAETKGRTDMRGTIQGDDYNGITGIVEVKADRTRRRDRTGTFAGAGSKAPSGKEVLRKS